MPRPRRIIDDTTAHDPQLRARLKTHLEQRLASGTATQWPPLIVDELALAYGAVRADVALIGARFEGFEIKAGRDTMVRLPRQMQAYDEVFERSWAVTVERHHDKVAALLPSWWGLLVTLDGQGDASPLVVVREARDNPMLDSAQLARLLWREEALALLEAQGLLTKALNRRPKLALFAALSQANEAGAMAALVRDVLRQRTGWRDEAGASTLTKNAKRAP